MAPNPNTDPTTYNVLVLASLPSPGVVKLEGVERETGWDQQEAQGQDGANSVKKGSKLVKFTARWKLTKDESRNDFAAWETWSKVLDAPVDSKSSKALDAYHPQLAEVKCRSVVLTKRGTIKPGEGTETGLGIVECEFLEFNPPKPAPATTPNGSAVRGRTLEVIDDPNADVKDQLAQRQKTLQALQDGHQIP
jgi:hypothetical protein